MENTSLDRLAHIANITHELGELDRQIKQEKAKPSPAPGNARFDTRKNRRLACTCCRQQKSKCDALEKHPEPCSRCAAKGLTCELRPDFKRTEKRARLAVIERQFAELRKSFATPDRELLREYEMAGNLAEMLGKTRQDLDRLDKEKMEMDRKLDRLDNVDVYGKDMYTRDLHAKDLYAKDLYGNDVYRKDPSEDPYAKEPSALGHEKVDSVSGTASAPGSVPDLSLGGLSSFSGSSETYDFACEEKSIGGFSLLADAICRLFREYVRCYHPLLPVVDVLKGPERIYRLCPALFWVLMFVALRRGDDALLLRLAPLVKDILAEITISPITRYNPTEEDEPIMNACSVYSVQAFVLYTLWPPLTSSLSADSSWNTIGVALFQAIRIGLHSPKEGALSAEHTKTWVVCNIVSQNIATAFGFPAFVQFDSLGQPDVPPATRHLMEIARFEDQVARTLGPDSVGERILLLKVLIRQLDELEMRHALEAGDDRYRKFRHIVARVHLLTYYFLDTDRMPALDLSKGLVRLYNAAIALINHVERCQAQDRNFVRFLPAVAILNIWLASCIIVKLAHSPLKMVLDVDAGKRIYATAVSLVAKASVLKHDIAYRASGIMRNMWLLFRTLDEKNAAGLALKIRSRMAASVFFDCLLLLRDQVGMAKLNIRTDPNVPDEAGDNDEAIVSSDDNAPEISGSTPGSTGLRKKRSLSGVDDAESKARRIIRTIPLDPQPIPAKKSSIFKVISSESSPGTLRNGTPVFVDFQSGNGRQSESPAHNVELDAFDINNHMLWKDVDSLMNDFGFHT